jgi:hypothetical protein
MNARTENANLTGAKFITTRFSSAKFHDVRLANASRIVKTKLLTASIVALVTLSGCVLPIPFRSNRTPGLSGRVVDSASRSPLPNSTVSFLQQDCHTPLPKPTATTDASGRFHLPRTINQHVVFVFRGLHDSTFWPDAPDSELLRIQHTGYATKTLALNAALKASGIADPHRSVGLDILFYDGLVPLGDIPLKR